MEQLLRYTWTVDGNNHEFLEGLWGIQTLMMEGDFFTSSVKEIALLLDVLEDVPIQGIEPFSTVFTAEI